MKNRPPLSRERIISAAVAVADRRSLEAVSMRSVAKELSVEAMSLYGHIGSKDDLLDALAAWLHEGVEHPDQAMPWREAMAARTQSLRKFLRAHPWGLRLIDSRPAPSAALLRHHDSMLGALLGNGFPMALAVHTFALLDAYAYGFVLTEQTVPVDADQSADEFAEQVAPPEDEYPNIARMLTEHVIGHDYVFADEFDFGLELILDGISARLDRGQNVDGPELSQRS